MVRRAPRKESVFVGILRSLESGIRAAEGLREVRLDELLVLHCPYWDMSPSRRIRYLPRIKRIVDATVENIGDTDDREIERNERYKLFEEE